MRTMKNRLKDFAAVAGVMALGAGAAQAQDVRLIDIGQNPRFHADIPNDDEYCRARIGFTTASRIYATPLASQPDGYDACCDVPDSEITIRTQNNGVRTISIVTRDHPMCDRGGDGDSRNNHGGNEPDNEPDRGTPTESDELGNVYE